MGLRVAVYATVVVIIVGFCVVIAALRGQAQRQSCAGDMGPVAGAGLEGLYRSAAARYRLDSPNDTAPDVGWAVLAAMNKIETEFGRNVRPSKKGAQGWMQFMPDTWAKYGVDADDDGLRDWNDPADAIYAAANDLSASGAPGDWQRAVFAYNHSPRYVSDVLAGARRYAAAGRVTDAPDVDVSRPAAATTPPPAGQQPPPVPAAAGCGSGFNGPLRDRIVQIARAELAKGVHEWSTAGRSNCNPYGPCDQWCAMFATWVWEQAGIPIREPMRRDGQSPWAVDGVKAYAQHHHLWKNVGDPPEPGDFIVFRAHISVVETVMPGGRITVIGGNQSDAVTRIEGPPSGLGEGPALGFVSPTGVSGGGT